MTFRKYLVLAGVTVFAAAGDSMLSHGMKQTGNISLHHLQGIILAVLNPWVAVGIVLLLAFFALLHERALLGGPDLRAAGHISGICSAGAGRAKFALHEQVSPLRWLGIALISGGVGFVAGGPALTSHSRMSSRNRPLLASEREKWGTQHGSHAVPTTSAVSERSTAMKQRLYLGRDSGRRFRLGGRRRSAGARHEASRRRA